MRLYYLDDSGFRGAGNLESPYFVVGGFGVDVDELPYLQRQMTSVAKAYGMKLGYPSELKFSHVGREKDTAEDPNWMVRTGLDRPTRRALVFSCLQQLLEHSSVTVLAGAVDRRISYGKSEIEHGMTVLMERIQFECDERSTKCLIFMDEEQSRDKALRSLVRSGSYYKKFARVLDTVSFMPSTESQGIQMADLIAGSISRHLNTKDDGYARRLWPAVRKGRNGLGDGYGVKVFPRGSCPEPRPQPIPWPDTDRRVHDAECKAYRRAPQWRSDGTPVALH